MLPRKRRNLVHVDTFFVDGVALEDIPAGSNKKYPGIVLFSEDWNDWYFLKERDGWTEEDYFQLARFKLKELGLETGDRSLWDS